jgi:predicted DNA-binding transcriptional regulator AlpA
MFTEALTMEMLTAEEVAKLMAVSASWLAQARCKRRGPKFVKIGQAVRYIKSDVEAWIAAQTVQTT